MSAYTTSDLRRMSKIGLVAVLEEVAEERDELREAWESCAVQVGELRAERDDAVSELRAERKRRLALEDMVDRLAR